MPRRKASSTTQGSFLDGFSLFAQDATLGLAYNVLGNTTLCRSATTLPEGRTTVGVVFERGEDDTGEVTLIAEGQAIGSVVISDVSRMSKMRGVDVGRDPHAPVTDVYEGTFRVHGSHSFRRRTSGTRVSSDGGNRYGQQSRKSRMSEGITPTLDGLDGDGSGRDRPVVAPSVLLRGLLRRVVRRPARFVVVQDGQPLHHPAVRPEVAACGVQDAAVVPHGEGTGLPA